jgi:uncharacterized protein YkwD
LKQTRCKYLLLTIAFLLAGCATSRSPVPFVGDVSVASMLSTGTQHPTSSPTATSTPIFTTIPASTLAPSATATSATLPSLTTTATLVYAGCSASFKPIFEAQVLTLVNQERIDAGLTALSLSSSLTKASRAHSLDMACNGFTSHTGSNGSFFGTRLTDAGFTFSTAAENIAAGYDSAFKVVEGWMNSAGHRANILNADMDYIGIGYVYNPNSIYKDYWTTDFGTP